MSATSPLAAKVQAVNQVNALARKYTPILKEALKPWIGKKVVSVNGPLLDKVSVALRAFLPASTSQESIWVSGRMFDLGAQFRVCVSWDDGKHQGCHYAETSASLGELERGHTGCACTSILKEVRPFEPLGDSWRTDYTEAEVIAAREELKAAKKLVDAAEGKLCLFGQYDN